MWESQYGFGEPFIDVDEWRDEPRRHRYVHGGFENSHTRFSFYLPPGDLYRGRFFQFLQGGAGGSESSLLMSFGAVTGNWVFDLVFDELGGYLVESNQGHFDNEGNLGLTGDVELFGASAESALFSKQVAGDMYGAAPHHGYVWGHSGGGIRTTTCLENRPDVWAGASPHVTGVGRGPQSWSAWAYWWLHCRDRRDEIVDATSPGGSGDPFAGMTTAERDALATLYRAGWPRGAENSLGNFFSWLFQITFMHNFDPTFEEDFFTKAGYLGHDEPEIIEKLLVDSTFSVTEILMRDAGEQYVMNPLGTSAVPLPEGAVPVSPFPERGASYGLVVDGDLGDADRIYMARATVLTGKAKGRRVHIQQGGDRTFIALPLEEPALFDGVEPGDQVRVENRDLIAYAHQWRHSTDLAELTIEDPDSLDRRLAPEFGGVAASMLDGRWIYPQRPQKPRVQTGRFQGKAIHVVATHDVMVMPAWVPGYERLVRNHWAEQTHEHYRLWWVENADHAGPYIGVTSEALRSLVDWCEDGVAPAPSTSYRFTNDGGIVLPATATERRGVQPVVRVTANGGERADVKVGEPVIFAGTIEQPPGAGAVVSAKWEFKSQNVPMMQRAFGTSAGLVVDRGITFGHLGDETDAPTFEHQVAGDESSVKVKTTFAYDTPGTYFARLVVAARRGGSKGSGEPTENEARARVVVS